MGLLTEGEPLSWAETKKYAELVKKTGILQFLATYHRLKSRPRDELKWGDEVCANLPWTDSPPLMDWRLAI